MNKSLRAVFEDFLASPSHHRLDELLHSQGGEYNHLEFKGQWIEYPKVAKHMLAIGNYGGGALVFGVSFDNGSLVAEGLQEVKDKATVHNGVFKYLPRQFGSDCWEVHDFSFEGGGKFQTIIIEHRPHILPLVSEKASGNDIREAAIYVRRGTSSVEANNHELQKILNDRIETGYSSTPLMKLEEHLDELKALYQRILAYRDLHSFVGVQISGSNPSYPQESYDQYIAKLIERKKQVIDALIGNGTS